MERSADSGTLRSLHARILEGLGAAGGRKSDAPKFSALPLGENFVADILVGPTGGTVEVAVERFEPGKPRFVINVLVEPGGRLENAQRWRRRALGGILRHEDLNPSPLRIKSITPRKSVYKSAENGLWHIREESEPPAIWIPGVPKRTRDIFWDAQQPQDLWPQLLIALAQLRLVSADTRLFKWLENYLSENFRWSIKGAMKKHRLSWGEVVQRASGHLVQHFSLPEHPYAFRIFVRKVVQWAGAENKPEYFDVFDTTRESYTVPEAAFHLEIPKRRLYRLIQERKIAAQKTSTEQGDKLLSIPQNELRRVAAFYAQKKQRKKVREELEGSGKSREAARKLIYRKRGRLPDIGTRA